MIKWIGLLLALVVIAACGGGGGGGTGGGPSGATLSGRVFQVQTGGAPNPQASVTAGGATTLTSAANGSFSLVVPAGTTSISVDTKTAQGVFTFTIPAVTGDTEIGDLWIGPEKVRVTGRLVNAGNLQPVAAAQVTFGGHTALTNADGIFNLTNVAYSSANQTAFWGIQGLARKSNFLTAAFTAQNKTAVNGVVTIGDVFITPTDDIDPPPSPFNLWGRISPAATAAGTVVTLKQNGNSLRTYTVGDDTAYFFWVTPGTYTLSYQKGNSTAPDQTVDIRVQNEVVRRDVTLQ